jgi:hypothetical protein
MVTKWSQNENAADEESSAAAEISKLLKEIGGRQGDRTPDLCIANVTKRKG